MSTGFCGAGRHPGETDMDDASDNRTRLSLREAAKLVAGEGMAPHDAEVLLAAAIQRGELHASIKRWASEQWEGRQLPGNIDARETFIERVDLAAWRSDDEAD